MAQFISEAANPKVGRKYQHIEDLVLSNGSHGGLHAAQCKDAFGEVLG